LAALLDTKQKKKNFVQSLVGYSLITYLLQVKDRHNGNIMIKQDGSILHIDYGFFMTNTPGKGV
jgi:phosphatidylinositol kinase/protein kinase (PI-3  family)